MMIPILTMNGYSMNCNLINGEMDMQYLHWSMFQKIVLPGTR